MTRPAEETRARLAGALRTVWARYRESVLDQVEVVESAVSALLEGALDAELRRRAEREAHKLAGAAGTFGFPDASRTARAIELLLEGEAALGAETALRLSDLAVELRSQLEAAASEGAPAEPVETAPPRVLLATADAELAARLETEASARGVALMRATGPANAVRALEHHAPAAVVVDLGDRPLDEEWRGFLEAAGRRDLPVPVLLLSKQDAFADRVDAARLGAAGFLRRPVPPSRVLDVVARLIRGGDLAGYRVLMVDDDPAVAAGVAAHLEPLGIELAAVDDARRLWSELDRVTPDLVILDHDLPHHSGRDLCRVLRGDPRWSGLPVLFLTARSDAASIEGIFAAGADDYVPKPVVGAELVHRIRNRLERVDARAGEPAGPATLPGRERSAAEIARTLHLARRVERCVAVARLDVDGLREINVAQGRRVGDEVLNRIVTVLQTILPAGDLVGGWGGDELVVALFDADREEACDRLVRALEAIASEAVPATDGALRVSFSGGVAEFPADGRDHATLVGAAEEALAAAKSSGGGAVRTFGSVDGTARAEVVDVAVVEDDRVLAGLLVHALETQGYRTRWIEDGEEAVRSLAGPRPSVRARVILLDVDLPGRDGIGVLREMARTGVTGRTRVVMLTVRSSEREVLRALELGAADHIAKPFSVSVLMRRIRILMERD